MQQPRLKWRPNPLTVGLLAARVAVVLVAIQKASIAINDDVARFHQIALAAGRPWHDFPVEYAPLELVIVRWLGATAAATLASRLAILACASDVLAWAAVRHGWGRSAGDRYLLLGTPLLVFIYARLDLVVVALAVWGAALAVRPRREGWSGVAFAAAILTKIWPVVLLPALAVERRARALAVSVVSVLAGMVAWITYAGVDGVRQVATFRGATGWGVEGVVGSVLWPVTDGPVRLEAGAPRIGVMPSGASAILGALLLLVSWAIWRRAALLGAPGFGAPAVAAVAALIACAPLLSLQYVCWLLPWAAIAGCTGERRLVTVVAVVEVLTGLVFIAYDPGRIGLSQALLLARNAGIVMLPAMWLRSQRRNGVAELST